MARRGLVIARARSRGVGIRRRGGIVDSSMAFCFARRMLLERPLLGSIRPMGSSFALGAGLLSMSFFRPAYDPRAAPEREQDLGSV